MGATKTDDGYLPSRTLSVLEGLAKGFGTTAKEVKASEMAKSQQMADAFKVIFPQYMMMMKQTQQQQFEAPYKRGALNLELAGLQQKGALGWANLDQKVTQSLQDWKIALMESTDKREIAGAANTLRVRLAEIDADLRLGISKYETEAGLKEARIGAEAGIKQARIRAESALDVLDVKRDDAKALMSATYDRMEQLEQMQIDAGKYASNALDPVTQQMFIDRRILYTNMRSITDTMAAMLVQDPELAVALLEPYKQMAGSVKAVTDALNEELQKQGRKVPGMAVPEYEVEPGKERPFWPDRPAKVVPKIPGTTPAPAPARGATPSVSQKQTLRGTTIDGMVRQGATKLSPNDRAYLSGQGLSEGEINAIETEARKRQTK